MIKVIHMTLHTKPSEVFIVRIKPNSTYYLLVWFRKRICFVNWINWFPEEIRLHDSFTNRTSLLSLMAKEKLWLISVFSFCMASVDFSTWLTCTTLFIAFMPFMWKHIYSRRPILSKYIPWLEYTLICSE